MREIKLNKLKVVPVHITDIKYTRKTLKSFDIIERLHWNLYCCARKESGKSSVISNIIDIATSKRTTIWLFCGTARLDKTYVKMIKALKKKGYDVHIIDTIVDATNDGFEINNLQVLIKHLSGGAITDEDFTEAAIANCPSLHFEPVDEKTGMPRVKKKRKGPKKAVPGNLIIFDDLSGELRNPAVAVLLKKMRHYDCSVIISSQSMIDIRPDSIEQIDYVINFARMPFDRLQYMHQKTGMTMPLEQFEEMYNYCTTGAYNFMFLKCKGEDIRKNFDVLIKYDDEEEEEE